MSVKEDTRDTDKDPAERPKLSTEAKTGDLESNAEDSGKETGPSWA